MKITRGQTKFVFAAAILIFAGLWVCEPARAGRITAWGYNGNGECDVPEGDDFVAISTSWKHGLALKSDGSIVGWGQNNHGQANAPAGNDFVAIAAGYSHSLALRSNGSLVAWGYNANHECDVPPDDNFTGVSAGTSHSVAMRLDGSLAAWGLNLRGECDVPQGETYVAVEAGARYTLALRRDGSLLAWGDLTNGRRFYQPPWGYDFTAIATGGLLGIYGLAIRTDGSIVAWGDNSKGQLNVPEGDDFIAVSAGTAHCLALKSDGSVVAWGENDAGQSSVPDVEAVVAIAAGNRYSVVLFELRIDPIAEAGPDIVASANEQVTLDASSSHDPDGQIMLYTWTRLPDGVVIHAGNQPTCTTRALGRAEEIIELTVTDNHLLTASDTLKITNGMLQNLQDQIDEMKARQVDIDVEPGVYPNTVSLGSYGLISVAILSTEQFDATTVDADTIELTGIDVAIRGRGDALLAYEADANADGLPDLIALVATANFEPDRAQQGYAVLTAKTHDGVPIEGRDEITIVPPEEL